MSEMPLSLSTDLLSPMQPPLSAANGKQTESTVVMLSMGRRKLGHKLWMEVTVVVLSYPHAPPD